VHFRNFVSRGSIPIFPVFEGTPLPSSIYEDLTSLDVSSLQKSTVCCNAFVADEPQSRLYTIDWFGTMSWRNTSSESVKSNDELDQTFRDDIRTLTNYSFGTRSNSDSFRIHESVQLSTQRWLDLRSEMNIWKLKYLEMLSAAVPMNPYFDWKKYLILLPHAEAAFEYIPIIEHDWQSWAAIILPVARLAGAIGRYDRA